MPQLSENARRKLSEPNLAFLATVMEDGGPHVSPVWVDLDGDHVLVNTVPGRLKERNIRRDARVAVSIADRNDPYDRVDIRGRVIETVGGDEAVRHIDALNRKYRDTDEPYPLPPGQERLILRIEPVAVYERP